MRGLLLGLLATAGMLARWQPRRAPAIDDALFRAFIRACPDIIWLKDADGVYIGCNDAAAAALGAHRNAIVGKSDEQLFAPEVARRYRAADLQVMAGRQCISEEVDAPTSGGQRILDIIKCPVLRADGRIEGVLGVARDVTERRRQERKLLEQEALLQDMSSLAKVGGWEVDLDAGTFTWTAEQARLHDLDPGQPLTLETCIEHYIEPDQARIREALGRTFRSGEPCDMDIQMQLPDGAHKWVRAHWRATMADGRVTRIWGMIQDVTERRKLDESIRMADLIYRTASEAILVTDSQNVIVDANPAFQRLTGYPLHDIVGAMPRKFLVRSDDDQLFDTITLTLNERGHWSGEMLGRHRDGRSIAVWVQIDIMRESGSEAFRRAIHIRDLTEQKDKDAQIWRHANFDRLTGLPNRSLLLDRLDQEIRKARGDSQRISVLCVDLDQFTAVNNMGGHAQGDAVLMQTAMRTRAALPDEATLSRLGSDRFAAMLPGSCWQLERHASALIDALAQPFAVGLETVHISASVGVSVYPDDGGDAHALVGGAEQAMAVAKRAGGNRFHFFAASLQETALAKLKLTGELRHALARNQLRLYYQPIVECETGRIRKAEALIRWQHPVHGLVNPGMFIPLAEESGLIVPIGDWVVDEAIASIQRWRAALGVDIELSVNQSALQFEQCSHQRWIDMIARAGLRPHSITVEITESMLVNDSARMQASLKLLQERGVKVSLDDFGTGFSALSYLKLFAVDYLKIDKSFVQSIEDDADDRALMAAIIDMSHKLRIQTIAEGVETPGQRDLLRQFGCDFLQGYLYSPAVPFEAFQSLLKHQAEGDQQ